MEYMAQSRPRGEMNVNMLKYKLPVWQMVKEVKSVAIGADFDGVESLPEQIHGVQDLNVLFNSLARLNYPDRVIRKIAGENLLRVFNDVLC
jgi:microsomal dipeptidase-like Zn-dependent dipeptidase